MKRRMNWKIQRREYDALEESVVAPHIMEEEDGGTLVEDEGRKREEEREFCDLQKVYVTK